MPYPEWMNVIHESCIMSILSYVPLFIYCQLSWPVSEYCPFPGDKRKPNMVGNLYLHLSRLICDLQRASSQKVYPCHVITQLNCHRGFGDKRDSLVEVAIGNSRFQMPNRALHTYMYMSMSSWILRGASSAPSRSRLSQPRRRSLSKFLAKRYLAFLLLFNN